jgi:uncharacterized protein YukE
MRQAIVSPEELRKFASDLKRFNEELNEKFNQTHARFKQLGETWRDQEHKKFEKDFDQTGRAIKQFLEASEEYVPFLTRKAEAAEGYLEAR